MYTCRTEISIRMRERLRIPFQDEDRLSRPGSLLRREGRTGEEEG